MMNKIEENNYQKWEEQNKLFLEKFVKEYITSNLKLNVDCDDGYVSVSALIDEEIFTESNDIVNIRHNSYDI